MKRVEKIEFAEFDWDPKKRASNVRKSGLDFADAALGLLQPHLEERSDRQGEPRTKAICISSGRIIIVVYTMRGELCRIIPAWPADKNEQRKFREIFG